MCCTNTIVLELATAMPSTCRHPAPALFLILISGSQGSSDSQPCHLSLYEKDTNKSVSS